MKSFSERDVSNVKPDGNREVVLTAPFTPEAGSELKDGKIR